MLSQFRSQDTILPSWFCSHVPSCSLVLRSRCFSVKMSTFAVSDQTVHHCSVSACSPSQSAYQSSGTRKVGSGYPTDSTCLYLGLRGQYFEFVHGSTATGSVPLILALGVRPFWVWGVRPPRSVSHLYPLLTLMLRVLRCLQTQWLVTGVGLGH